MTGVITVTRQHSSNYSSTHGVFVIIHQYGLATSVSHNKMLEVVLERFISLKIIPSLQIIYFNHNLNFTIIANV